MVLLTSFARERQVTADAVSTYIRRHKSDFEGHTKKKGNRLLLDDDALIMLDSVYPLPKPVEVIEDTESRQKLIKAQELIIKLQASLAEKEVALAQAEAIQLLLEDKTHELELARAAVAEKEKALADLQSLYEMEQKKSWWDKLRHR